MKSQIKKKNFNNKTTEPIRLYSKAIVTGYKRSKVNQTPDISLLNIEGVKTKEEAKFYLGKRCAYIYKAKTIKNGTKFRVIQGLIRRSYGNNGAVCAKFRKALPPSSFGGRVRVFLFPSNI
ncbi:60s ribosomal protein L35a [Cryptosporidium ubiquitum]|uniref:60s ribosomal protein L35a n=1 Tax=Cryptosporidium ubiquitum TaxID=857276 RepID=A0A1J4MIT5_9CRYT|nr:60s ribosomal protein L35a [Cryptosporidium ubiquitum]OII74128.1 60s ribosomal protein L35a [Cryptosporidium ubiquitum]